MKQILKDCLQKLGIKGRVRNHSSKDLWVIESTTNHPHGPPLAHILGARMKSPAEIDADGFKRFDGKVISNHKSWWKITNFSTADVFDSGEQLLTLVAYKAAVSENHFGTPAYLKAKNWGEPINYILAIKRVQGRTAGYYTSNMGFVDKKQGVQLALEGKIDLAVVVNAGKKSAYLRSYPGQQNFKERA